MVLEEVLEDVLEAPNDLTSFLTFLPNIFNCFLAAPPIAEVTAAVLSYIVPLLEFACFLPGGFGADAFGGAGLGADALGGAGRMVPLTNFNISLIELFA